MSEAKDNSFEEFEREMRKRREAQAKRKQEMEAANEAIPQEVRDKVKKRLDEEFPQEHRGFGSCHAIWHREGQLFAEYGYTWYSPSTINPTTLFD